MKRDIFRRYCSRYAIPNNALVGKTVVITGSTGGLGRPLCRYLCELGASLILVDRNAARSTAHKEALLKQYPHTSIECITADLAVMDSVKHAVSLLQERPIDIFLHNAGAYSIPRTLCDSGFDILFQINFVAPYFMINALLPTLAKRHGHVVAVSSIAHTYCKTDPDHVDRRGQRSNAKAYGNAKRHLMFALHECFSNEQAVTLSVVHPGISFTGITDHYPPWLFALIKHPMKVIFMPPAKATLCILHGVVTSCSYGHWIGPRLGGIWGYPKISRLHTCSETERRSIAKTALTILSSLS